MIAGSCGELLNNNKEGENKKTQQLGCVVKNRVLTHLGIVKSLVAKGWRENLQELFKSYVIEYSLTKQNMHIMKTLMINLFEKI